MPNPKVSVIMASYLGSYPGSASNRDKKFIRAVNSFKKQTYENKELIIVSDGCPLTIELYKCNSFASSVLFPKYFLIISIAIDLSDDNVSEVSLRTSSSKRTPVFLYFECFIFFIGLDSTYFIIYINII